MDKNMQDMQAVFARARESFEEAMTLPVEMLTPPEGMKIIPCPTRKVEWLAPESVTDYMITERRGERTIEYASPPSAGETLSALDAAAIDLVVVGPATKFHYHPYVPPPGGMLDMESTKGIADQGEVVILPSAWKLPPEELKVLEEVGIELATYGQASMKITDGSGIHDVTIVKSAEDFKVGDKVFTVIDEDVGYDPRFTAKTMIIPESAPLSIDKVTYYGFCKPTYTLSNGEVYVALWLALAPKADFLCPQVHADEEYDPEKVMEAIRKSSGG